MRRFTLITIICLVVLLAGAAVAQLIMAGADRDPYPGPVPGTPYIGGGLEGACGVSRAILATGLTYLV